MNDSKLYNNLLLKKPVYIKPSLLNKNLNESILKKITDKYNGKCAAEGYIKTDSIKIIKRTIGKLDGSNFKGYIKFDVVFSADICNPVNGSIIKCIIKNVNKLGLFAQDGPLSIIIPRDYHESKGILKELDIGDSIKVEVLGKQFQLNDTVALIIGRLSGNIVKKKFKIKKIKIENKQKNVDIFNDSGLEEVTNGEENEEKLTDNLMDNDEEMMDEFEDLGESEDDYLEDKEEVSFDLENNDDTDEDDDTDDTDDTDEDDDTTKDVSDIDNKSSEYENEK